MSKIHYFQRYSQRENVATNNTLLLFSRLYNESPYKFNDFINSLLKDKSLEIGVTFNQQEKSEDSIPDGIMSQKSFKVAIETKLGSGKNFGKSQLINHLKSLKKEEQRILLALSPTRMEDELFQSMKAESSKQGVTFLNVTFKDIVEAFNDAIADYDIQLKEIIDDYEDYCIQEWLIKDTDSRIRIVPCGNSYELNLEYGIHYMPADRGITEHGYFGVYNDKRVKGIGKISNMVVVEASPVGEEVSIKVLEEKHPLTTEQHERIIGIIKETREKIGWDLSDVPHRYTIVDEFYDTDYRKTTKGGIQGHRYQNLKDILGMTELPTDKEIAEELKDKTWK